MTGLNSCSKQIGNVTLMRLHNQQTVIQLTNRSSNYKNNLDLPGHISAKKGRNSIKSIDEDQSFEQLLVTSSFYPDDNRKITT